MAGSVTHSVPLDILVLFALAGGPRLVLAMAATCSAMKCRLDRRYTVSKRVDWNDVMVSPDQRRTGVVGKFLNVFVGGTDMQYLYNLPDHIQQLQVDVACDRRKHPCAPQWLLDGSGSLDDQVAYCREWRDDACYPRRQIKLPESLQKLTFGHYYEGHFDTFIWPDGLKFLHIRKCHKSLLQANLPVSLERLSLMNYGSFFASLEGWATPPHLQYLSMYKLPWRGIKLSKHLKVLELTGTGSPLEIDLPEYLEELILHIPAGTRLDALVFPKSLKHIWTQNDQYARDFLQGHGFISCDKPYNFPEFSLFTRMSNPLRT